MDTDSKTLRRLRKADRDELFRLNRFLRKDGRTDRSVVERALAAIRSQAGDLSPDKQHLALSFGSAMSHFKTTSIIDRILHDDPSFLLRGLATQARFGYLDRLGGGVDNSGGYDCLHVFSLLSALACNDMEAVARFLTGIAPPFIDGHPSTVLLCNGVYAALDPDPEALKRLVTKLTERKESKYFRVMYDCLIAIAEESSSAASAAIGELMRLNRRQSEKCAMEKLICLDAHAFYRLCAIASPKLELTINLDAEFPWDSEFHSYLDSLQPTAMHVFPEVLEVNQVLTRWLFELPDSIDVQELTQV